MSGAIQAGDYDQGSGDLFSGNDRAKAAGTFRNNTSIGGDCWPLHEYGKIDEGDLERFSGHAASWKGKRIVPMQYLLNVMSISPRDGQKGAFA